MKRESLLVLNQTINYSVKVSDRAQRLRVAVYADGDVIVTKPKNTPTETLKKFLESKKIWILNKVENNKISPIPELLESSDQHYADHQQAALDLVTKKVKKWNRGLKYDFDTIKVKKLKSRWGSCSSKNTLSFNYKILFLPEKLQDYIVVHELCHLKERNHSFKYWKLVSSVLPDYSDLKEMIRHI